MIAVTPGAASPAALDLDAYLRRIGYSSGLGPTRATLDALHLAHASRVPFENLDILLGRPIRLDLASLQAKLVGARRGGYCFEQNALFAAMLEHLGFDVTRLAARVRHGTDRVLPRTHMTLAVDIGGARFLADVGFGATGMLLPVPLDGTEARQFSWAYRVVADSGARVLQSRRGDAWENLYEFTPEPQLPVDYELANYYTSTNPASRFTQAPTAQRLAPEARWTLRGRDYTVERGGTIDARTIRDDDELLAILASDFGLVFPSGTRFVPLAAPA